jgi:hypothetical protein
VSAYKEKAAAKYQWEISFRLEKRAAENIKSVDLLF